MEEEQKRGIVQKLLKSEEKVAPEIDLLKGSCPTAVKKSKKTRRKSQRIDKDQREPMKIHRNLWV